MGLKLLLSGVCLALCLHISSAILSMKPVSTIHIPYDIVPSGGQTEPLFALNRGAAEKTAYDADNAVAYTAGKRFLHVINFFDIYKPVIDRSFRLTAPVTDIAECGEFVAFVSPNPISVANPGTLFIYRKEPMFDSVCNITVDSRPVSLKFNWKCDTIVVANEGPAMEDLELEMFVNPEGTVSIVRLNNTMVDPSVSVCPTLPLGTDVRSLDFTAYNEPQFAPVMEAQFIRNPYKGQMDAPGEHTFSMNVEPEYVTLDPYQNVAYVSLQENNAIAQIFLNNMTSLIHPVGLKNWTNYDIDASRRDGPGTTKDIVYRRFPIESLLQPDAVEFLDANGESFLVTANEGKPTSYMCNECPEETEFFDHEVAAEIAGDQLLTQNVPAEVRQAMMNPRKLGHLRISMIDGLVEPGAEMINRPVFFGGRGISMFRVTPSGLELAWDSGDAIAKGISELYPNAHNFPPFGNPELMPGSSIPSNFINRRWDYWSPWMGPECQSLAVGWYNTSHKVIVVGINGAHALGLFTVPITGPGNETMPRFESIFRDGEVRAKRRVTYNRLYQTDLQNLQNPDLGNIGDLDPDSVIFISPEKTVGRVPLVMVTGRVSGTITVYKIHDIPRHQLLRTLKTELDRSGSNALTSSMLTLLLSIAATFYMAFSNRS